MENEVFDMNEALSRADDDRELFRELAEIFLKSYSKQLSDVQSAITKKDGKALEKAAHCIKGSVATFCAKPAFEAAFELEIIGRGNNMSNARETYKALENEIGRLTSALEAIEGEA